MLMDERGVVFIEIVDGLFRVDVLSGEKSALCESEESRGA